MTKALIIVLSTLSRIVQNSFETHGLSFELTTNKESRRTPLSLKMDASGHEYVHVLL